MIIDYIQGFSEKFFSILKDIYWDNFDVVLISFFISSGMAILVLMVETLLVGFNRSGLRRLLFIRSKSTLIDIVYFFLHTTNLILFLAILMSFGIPYIASSAIKDVFNFDLDKNLPPIVQLSLFLLLADFMAYWQHRIMHMSKLLWKIHEFHHSAEEFNTLTVFREHPLDKALNALFMAVPAIVLGVPAAEYPLFVTIFGIIGYIKHSNIPWHGPLGKWVVQSPRDHWIHHSKSTIHHNSNYANNFPIWDHMFGTYYNGDNFDAKLGLVDNPYNKSSPFRETLRVEKQFLTSLAKVVFGSWLRK